MLIQQHRHVLCNLRFLKALHLALGLEFLHTQIVV